jgi:heme a synthase
LASPNAADHLHPAPSKALRRFSWGVLVYFIAVILLGALVRATGSGAGCGNHWPLCNGTVIQHSATVNTLIEFIHRITSAVSLLAVAGLVAWSFRRTVSRHMARWTATGSLVFTLLEAILGALLVELGLTAQSQSPLRPVFLSLHLANTLLLVAALALTAHLLDRNSGYRWKDIRVVQPFSAAICIVLVMLVGVTGSLAALGDTLFPVTSLREAIFQDLVMPNGWLVRWRWLHPSLAIVTGVFLYRLMLRASRRISYRDNRGLAALFLLMLVCVYPLGVADVLLLAPVWAQLAHLLAAESLWVVLVVLTARLTLEPVETT